MQNGAVAGSGTDSLQLKRVLDFKIIALKLKYSN
jgi:hypothetical protein